MDAADIVSDDRPRRARAAHMARIGLAIVAMAAAIAMAIWLAFGTTGGGGGPKRIAADSTPERSRPAPGEQGGAVIAHQEQQVFEIVGRESEPDGAEAMAPAAETPLPAPEDAPGDAPANAPALNADGGGPVQLLPPEPSPEEIDPRAVVRLQLPPLPPANPDAATAPSGPADGETARPQLPPLIVETEDAADEGPEVIPGAPGQPAVVEEDDRPPPRDFPPRRPPELGGPGAAPAAEAPAAAPEPPAAPQIEAPAPAADPNLANLPQESQFRIQIGAVRDRETAQREWRRMRQANADILGNMQLFIQRVDIAGRGVFHRIQAGPLPDANLAELACGQLRSRNMACFVVAK